MELHDFIDLDNIDDEALINHIKVLLLTWYLHCLKEVGNKRKAEDQLDSIRTRMEEMKRQDEERKKIMENLRKEEEAILAQQKIKKEKN